MDEGTYEELLNLFGPKIQKQDAQISDAIAESTFIYNTAFSCYRQLILF